MAYRCSRHVADTPVGEIPGYAQLPPPAGVAEMSASGHRLRQRRRANAALRQSATNISLALGELQTCGGLLTLAPSGVCASVRFIGGYLVMAAMERSLCPMRQ